MFRHTVSCIVIILLVMYSLLGFVSQIGEAAQYKVLVVMSYEETYPWCQEIKEGIERVLGEVADIRYFYMNTKVDLEGGPQKAQEASKLYQEFQPDGVITVDDNAQTMFVMPYLKDVVDTPVMFCGVNANPEKYGYPASNVSGILERGHIRESIVFVQQIVPSITTIGFMMKESPTGQAVLENVQQEAAQYPAQVVAFKIPKTLEEAVVMAQELQTQVDALFFETMEAMPTADAKTLSEREIIARVAAVFGKPTISDYENRLKGGALCAVVKTGQEQGGTAAEMLLKAIQGTPVADIPITRNQYGRRIVNVDAMKALNIKLKPELARGIELVKTEK
jgi:ABC-type uncharacterized transport system substrate-binding protein